MLPTLPTLPARLRLSDSEGEEEDEGDEDIDDTDAIANNNIPHYHNSNPTSQPQDYLSHQPFYNQHPSATHASNTSLPHPHPYPDELTPAPPHYDPILADLMHRYRARKADTPQANTTSRTRTTGGSKIRDPRNEEHDEEAEEERTELLAHLMGKMRREAARADEEAWMFGDGVGAAAGMGTAESAGLMGGGGYVGVGVTGETA
jgi:hypothetical protein